MLFFKTPDASEQPLAVDSNLSTSILNSLLKAGVPVRHDCGGKALCGTCRVAVKLLKGKLSPVKPLESGRLAFVGALPGERLACQCFVRGDAEVAIAPKNL
jgi:ferredoxin